MSLQMTAGLGSWSLPFATAPGIKKWKPGAYLIPLHQPERTMREGHLGAVWQRVGGFAPRFRKPGVENMNAMLGLVAAGEGLAFIPELIFDRFPPCTDWTSRPLRPAKPAFAFDAVWNPAHVSHTLSTYLSFFPEPDFASKKVDAPSPQRRCRIGTGEIMPEDDQEKESDQKQPTSESPSQKDGDEPGKKAQQGPKKKRKAPVKSMLIGGIILLIILFFGYRYWQHASTHEDTDDAYTAGNAHQISPRVAGTVQQVLVDDNWHVDAGQPLVKLDPRDFEVALVKNRAQLKQANAQVIQAQAAAEQANAVLLQQQAGVTLAAAQIVESHSKIQRTAQERALIQKTRFKARRSFSPRASEMISHGDDPRNVPQEKCNPFGASNEAVKYTEINNGNQSIDGSRFPPQDFDGACGG